MALVTTSALVVRTEAMVLVPLVMNTVVVTPSVWLIAMTVVWVVAEYVDNWLDVVDMGTADEVVEERNGVVDET